MRADLEHQAKELFQRAAALPDVQRNAFLRAHCTDQQIFQRVEQLLRHDDIVGSAFLRGAEVAGAAQSEPTAHPQQIGRFRILSVLGRGGMGTVYEAEQDKPHRKVALKVIRPGWMSHTMLRRFEYEAELLARLDHPGIARVYDVGTADSGHGPQPYFAMELVRGQRLDAYIRDKNPPTKRRLELLIEICQAVHHAHTKGIIHRDLKPANILITEEGKPKILDFGVARATDSDIQSTTLHTESGQILGTLPYMAPEQAAGRAHELDTSSDVYALGVIAYELLSGRMPYALEGKALHEAVRVICEDEPSRLSSVNKSLRGDVETIVGKALEKDKTRRYHTAGELAADVKRYLDYEPITARPPGTWYQLSRFARRNKLVVGSISLVLLAFAGATVISTTQAIRATRARDEAERSQKQAQSVLQFVTNSLKNSDPEDGGKQDTTILQAMDNAIQEIQNGAFKDDPQTDASLRSTIASILHNNGRTDHAEPLAEQALRLRQRLYKGDHPDVAASLGLLAWTRYDLGRLEQAEPLYQQALEMRQRLYKGDHFDVADSLESLGMARLHLRQGEPLLQQALEMYQRLYKEDHPAVAKCLHNLALARGALGRLEQAEPLHQQALEMRQRLFKGDHPDVASGLTALGLARNFLGRPERGELLLQQALEMNQRLYSGDHPQLADSLRSLALVRRDLGRPEQAEPLFQQALEMYQRLYTGDHQTVMYCLNNLALTKIYIGRPEQAEPLAEQALEMYQRVHKGDHRTVASSLNTLGLARQGLGRREDAELLCRQAMEMYQRLHKGDHVDVAQSLINLAMVYRDLDRLEQAEPLLSRALEMRQRLFKRDDPAVARNLIQLAGVRRDLGRADEAEPLAREAVAMAMRIPSLGPKHPQTAKYAATHAKCLDSLGRRDEAAAVRKQFGLPEPTTAPSTAPLSRATPSARTAAAIIA